MELLQIATAFLLQSATVYYKLRQVLQIATVPLGQNIQYERGGDARRLA